jgi:hypothetical protein
VIAHPAQAHPSGPTVETGAPGTSRVASR